MSAARRKGTAWESAIVAYLRANGVPYAERRALNGNLDRGDIAGIPGIVIEAKSGALHLAQWVAEAETEKANDGADFGIVWAKRAGKASPADGYAILSGAALIDLLRAARYIADPVTIGFDGSSDPTAVVITAQRPDGTTEIVSPPSDDHRAAYARLLAEIRALIQRHDPPPYAARPLPTALTLSHTTPAEDDDAA